MESFRSSQDARIADCSARFFIVRWRPGFVTIHFLARRKYPAILPIAESNRELALIPSKESF
jgi:hypothetical protein